MGQVNELKDFTRGQLDAALMKIGQDVGMGTADGIRAFLANKLSVSKSTRRWREQDGVTYFSVTSDGTTGPQWIERLEKKGIKLSKWAKDVLNSPDFKPTNGATTEVAVLKGMLFEDNDRVTSKIRAEAGKRKLVNPNAELGCLVRDMFTDEEIEAMGLVWIVTMHKPIKDSDGDTGLLGADRSGSRPDRLQREQRATCKCEVFPSSRLPWAGPGQYAPDLS